MDDDRSAKATGIARASEGIFACSMALALSACDGEPHLSFLDPQGAIAAAQASHFAWVLGIMALLVVGPIFLLLPFFAWRYRHRNKKACYTPRWEDSNVIVVMSWAGPLIIVLVLSFFTWRDAHQLDPYRPLAAAQPPLRIEVIGFDWKWMFIYPQQGIASIGTLVLPVGRPVRLYITSATVMQSFFIPALGSQIYAMGGMVTQLNLKADAPGTSLGENTMYNGEGFHRQKFLARTLPPEDFAAWVSRAQTQGLPLDAARMAIIARPGVQDDVTAALPGTQGGDVYFTSVSPSLFPAVVMATMDGRQTLPNAAFCQAGPLVPVDSPCAPGHDIDRHVPNGEAQ